MVIVIIINIAIVVVVIIVITIIIITIITIIIIYIDISHNIFNIIDTMIYLNVLPPSRLRNMLPVVAAQSSACKSCFTALSRSPSAGARQTCGAACPPSH